MRKYIRVEDNRENLDDLYQRIERIQNIEIRVGVFAEDSNFLLMIARVHEFGVSIKVTEKMRNYLHAKGLHLRSDTTHINIPERSYIRTTVDKQKRLMKKTLSRHLEDYLKGQITYAKFTQRVGNFLSNLVKKEMIDLKEPELHPFTIEQKGSDNPLIDSGDLLNNITYKVVK